MDIMNVNKTPVLHIVDTTTNFQNAICIISKPTGNPWKAFITCWASFYTCFMNIIGLDRESSFPFVKYLNNDKDLSITLQFSGIESHNAIGQGGRQHYPLCLILNIMSK